MLYNINVSVKVRGCCRAVTYFIQEILLLPNPPQQGEHLTPQEEKMLNGNLRNQNNELLYRICYTVNRHRFKHEKYF
ncbi:MAG: hypothetical protein ACI92I_000197 [Acidimicrobiales bacterium]|jgi:hypothetical protein